MVLQRTILPSHEQQRRLWDTCLSLIPMILQMDTKWILGPQRRMYVLLAYEQAASQGNVTRAYLCTMDYSTAHSTQIQEEENVQASLTWSYCFRALLVILILHKETVSSLQWLLRAEESGWSVWGKGDRPLQQFLTCSGHCPRYDVHQHWESRVKVQAWSYSCNKGTCLHSRREQNWVLSLQGWY